MDKSRTSGTIAAFGAFIIWGLLPLYWAPLRQVGAIEIIWHRIFWSLVPSWLIVMHLIHSGRVRAAFPARRITLIAFANGLLVTVNWTVYIYAVINGRAVDASLGYYINPLVSVLLGTVLLRERLSRLQWAAVLVAAAGVLLLTLRVGRVPWIALILAFTFGSYGLVKKRLGLDPMHSLALEMVPVGFVAAAAIAHGLITGTGHLVGYGALTTALLLGAGVATLLPLWLFGIAAARIPLSQVGFTQYITPTMILFIGVAVFGEPFDAARAPGFVLVWIALALYTWASVHGWNAARRARV